MPQGRGKPARLTQQMFNWFERMAAKYGISEYIAVVLGIAMQESDFNQGAISGSGAIGIMQLMPGTAHGLKVNPYDWRQNIEGGVKYFAEMLHYFKGNLLYAVGAYNAGPGNPTGYQGQYVPDVLLNADNFTAGYYGYDPPKYPGQGSQSPGGPFPKLPTPQGSGSTRDPIIGEFNGLPIYQSQFRALWMAYSARASAYGFQAPSESQVWSLVHDNVDTELYGYRMSAMRTVTDNKHFLDAFEKLLGKKLNLQQRLDFVTREGPKEWYDLWNKAAVAGAAQSEGFKFLPNANRFQRRAGVGDLVLNKKDVTDFLGRIGSSPNPDTQEYMRWLAQGALLIHRLLPESRYQGLGLKKGDLLDVAAQKGTPQANQVVERLTKEEDLFRQGQGYGNVSGVAKGQPAVEGLGGLSGTSPHG